MQKKIIALAIAAAFATPAIAAADVVIYGQANGSIQYSDNDVKGGNSGFKIANNDSRLGFKGSEDLGGLTALFQIESAVALEEGVSGIAGRNSFVGLSSADMGTVVLGKHDTPYKLATRGLDVFFDTAADNRSLLSGHNLRADNVLAYLTPNLNGFNGAIAVSGMGEGAEGQRAYSLMGSYTTGAFTGSLAHQNYKPAKGIDSSKATKLGLGYSDAGITLNGEIEDTNDTKINVYVGGKYAFGMDAVKVAFTHQGDVDGTKDTGAKQYSVGYDHGMSKNTTVYALYSTIRNDDFGGAGFDSGTNEAVIGGENPSVFAVGVKHKF